MMDPAGLTRFSNKKDRKPQVSATKERNTRAKKRAIGKARKPNINAQPKSGFNG